MGNYEASWAVRYVVMIFSLGCSLLISAVVIIEQLYKDTFPQLILIVQLEFVVIALLEMCFPAYYSNHLACQIIGYIILSLWMVLSSNSLEFISADAISAVHHREETWC